MYRLLHGLLHHPFHRKRNLRVWTMLLGLCYLVVSVFLPFQHTHIGGEDEAGGVSSTWAQASERQLVFTQPPAIQTASTQIASMQSASTRSASRHNASLRRSALNKASQHTSAPKPAFVKAGKKRSTHCLACEWESMQVSAALPTFTLYLSDATPPRVITTLPRYLLSRAIATSSRGPPTV